MNDQTPRPRPSSQPESSDHANTVPLPDSVPAPAAPAESTEPARRQRRGIARPVLIGAASAAAVLLVGGGIAAIAFSVADNNDDARDAQNISDTNTSGRDTGARGDDDQNRSTTDGSSSGSGQSAQSAVPADAAALADAIDAAMAAVPGGTGATSVEIERDGWDVDIAHSDGTESDVRVSLDGTATVRGTDDDVDNTPDPLLDTSRLAAIVDAAIDAAGGGTIDSISTDDDNGRHYYDVDLNLGNGRDSEVTLAEDLAVVSVDTDD